FGYGLDEDRKLKIIPEEAKAVKMIFEMFANGYGYTAIIRELNKQGYKTKRGADFGKNSLFEILRNEKYTGTYVFNKLDSRDCNGRRNGNRLKTDDKVIRVENGCPQIISKELFDKVQKRKEDNRRSARQYHSREFYIMTGKIFCGVCGKRMQGNLRFSGRNKSRLSTYRCNTLRINCNNKEVNKDYLDEYIIKLIANKILNAKALKSAVNKLNKYINQYNAEYEDNSLALKNELSEVCESLENITKAIEKGIINDSIITRASELEERKTQLEIQLSEMHQYDEMRYEDFEYLLKEYKNLEAGTEEYRTFLQQFVNKIMVYPYELKIELNMGLGITDDLTEIITIRRGELYGMFESKVNEKENLRYV
ncbi:MAG: recombinase family protein, partial [Ruminococcus sp.]